MYPRRRKFLWCLIIKGIKIIIRIHVCLFWQINIDSKENGGEKNFSWETQTSTSCITMRWKYLCSPITKWIEILQESMFTFFGRWTLHKENGGKKSFSQETQASISCIPIKRKCLWYPITKRMDTITRIHVHLFWGKSLILKKMVEGKAFLEKLMHPNHVSQ